ncbi:MAG: FHA domain-containing protein [Archangiaceae bacterium]|nr:FHA domain-containing protein [Archangiaceae bacterium]
MAFQLVIAEGKEAGREFVFEQESVLIGRTSDCDVVLYDPGVSRKHARIFSESAGYYVEDMGSSNGTKVNGAIIKKRQLADGDAISLGPVVFNFAGLALEEESTDASVDAAAVEAGGSTRIVAASDVKRTRGKGAALMPEGANPDQLADLARSTTRSLQAIKPRSSQPNGRALARGSESSGSLAPARVRDRGAISGEVRGSSGGLSAAERARIRRQAGATAGLKIMWAEASLVKRLAIGLSSAVLVLGLLAAAVYFAFPSVKPVDPGPEPVELVPNQPIEASFGYGDDVKFERVDQKVFDFEYKSPVKTVAVLHFQAKDISDKEVGVSVNGTEVGYVPADTMTVNERSNELLVPATALLRNGRNKIIFDNTKNPPAKETWRVWNVWVEVFPLPELGRDELQKNAQDSMRRAQDFWDRREVGAENQYKAWRAFRDSWLVLESIEGTKPEAYIIAREKTREAQASLDRLCSKLLLEAQSAYNQKQFENARSTLEHVNEYFPKRDQPCPFRAEQMRELYGI